MYLHKCTLLGALHSLDDTLLCANPQVAPICLSNTLQLFDRTLMCLGKAPQTVAYNFDLFGERWTLSGNVSKLVGPLWARVQD